MEEADGGRGRRTRERRCKMHNAVNNRRVVSDLTRSSQKRGKKEAQICHLRPGIGNSLSAPYIYIILSHYFFGTSAPKLRECGMAINSSEIIVPEGEVRGRWRRQGRHSRTSPESVSANIFEGITFGHRSRY